MMMKKLQPMAWSVMENNKKNFWKGALAGALAMFMVGAAALGIMRYYLNGSLVLPDIVFQITQTRFVVINKRLRVFCIRKADNIAVLGFMKADKARKPCHLCNLDQGVVIILTAVYV
jgi:hypothetical protein